MTQLTDVSCCKDFSGRTFFAIFELGPRRPLLVSGAIVRMDLVAVWQVLYRTPGKAARHHFVAKLHINEKSNSQIPFVA